MAGGETIAVGGRNVLYIALCGVRGDDGPSDARPRGGTGGDGQPGEVAARITVEGA